MITVLGADLRLVRRVLLGRVDGEPEEGLKIVGDRGRNEGKSLWYPLSSGVNPQTTLGLVSPQGHRIDGFAMAASRSEDDERENVETNEYFLVLVGRARARGHLALVEMRSEVEL